MNTFLPSVEIPDHSDLVGLPFVWFGRDARRDGGLSCMGVFLEMQRRMGRNVLDPMKYPDLASEQWDFFERGPWILGDGLLFAHDGKEMGSHIAFYLGDTRIIHAVEHKGTMVSEIDDVDMRVELVYRWKGI